MAAVLGGVDETLPDDKFWNAEQAASYVGVHVDTLRKWVRLRKSHRYRYQERERISAFLVAHRSMGGREGFRDNFEKCPNNFAKNK